MKREFSAGGIVLRLPFDKLRVAQDKFLKNRVEVLVTQHSQNHHWSFPKGLTGDHPEQTLEESALREVREEGGIEAKIIGKVGYSKYTYTLNGEKIFKIVTYFLMQYVSGDIKDHDWEVSDIGWFAPEDALKRLSFSQDKELLKRALELKT